MYTYLVSFLAFYFGWSMMASIDNDFDFLNTVIVSLIYAIICYLIDTFKAKKKNKIED